MRPQSVDKTGHSKIEMDQNKEKKGLLDPVAETLRGEEKNEASMTEIGQNNEKTGPIDPEKAEHLGEAKKSREVTGIDSAKEKEDHSDLVKEEPLIDPEKTGPIDPEKAEHLGEAKKSPEVTGIDPARERDGPLGIGAMVPHGGLRIHREGDRFPAMIGNHGDRKVVSPGGSLKTVNEAVEVQGDTEDPEIREIVILMAGEHRLDRIGIEALLDSQTMSGPDVTEVLGSGERSASHSHLAGHQNQEAKAVLPNPTKRRKKRVCLAERSLAKGQWLN